MAGSFGLRHRAMSVALADRQFALHSPASAQEWPSRTVTIVVPLAAGSASDIVARVVADQLSKQLKATFIVENRPGAGGTVGAGAVARSAPDGYTILAYGALVDRAGALFEAALRHAQRLHSGHRARTAGAGDHDCAVQGLQDARRPDRRRQGQAGGAELFVGGRRIGVALCGRTPDGGRRIHGPAHPLQGLGRVAQGNHRGPRGLQHSVVRDDGAAHSERHACAARSQRAQARPPSCRTCRRRSRRACPRNRSIRSTRAFTCPRRPRASIVEKLHSEVAEGAAVA